MKAIKEYVVKKIRDLSLLTFGALCLLGLSGCGGSTTSAGLQLMSGTGDADSVKVTLSSGVITDIPPINISNLAQSYITLDNTGKIVEMKFSNVDGNVEFKTENGDVINQISENGMTLFESVNDTGTAAAVAMGDKKGGYAVYMSSNSPTEGFGAATVFSSQGHKTTLPRGTFSYNGAVIGIYAGEGFTVVKTSGSMTAMANFDTKAVAFSTSNTKGYNSDGTLINGDYSFLNIPQATLSDTNGNGIFYGTIADTYNIGSAEIKFYGSASESAAGIGSLTDKIDNPGFAHIIAFGGTR